MPTDYGLPWGMGAFEGEDGCALRYRHRRDPRAPLDYEVSNRETHCPSCGELRRICDCAVCPECDGTPVECECRCERCGERTYAEPCACDEEE